MENKKICPYCGEEIAAAAKKCRFCGEWLQGEDAVLVPEAVETETVEYKENQGGPVFMESGNMGEIPATVNINGMPQNARSQTIRQYPAQNGVSNSGQSFQQPVINIQLAQETNVSQEVNQTVVNTSEKSSGSGFLWFELMAVGGAVWWGTGHWWAGLVTWILLAIATQIPIIGGVLCFLLGAGIGLLAGVIAAAFSAPVWVCWVIGIIVGLGVTGLNFEDKDADD